MPGWGRQAWAWAPRSHPRSRPRRWRVWWPSHACFGARRQLWGLHSRSGPSGGQGGRRARDCGRSRDRSHLACFRRRVEDAASMTRTARTKHWRTARVQIQFLPSPRKEEAIVFWQVSGCQVALGLRTQKGERYSIRANPARSCCAVRIDRVCHWEFHFWKSLESGSRRCLTNQEFRPDVFSSRSCLPRASRCAGRGPGKASTGLLDFNLVVGPFEASAVCRRRRRSTLRRAR